MNRKLLYPLLLFVVMAIIYCIQDYLDTRERHSSMEMGKQSKELVNEAFLPTSTTGVIVHHINYSLSYSEPNEQAEWVAYELSKEQLMDTKFKRPYFEMDDAVPTQSANWRNYKNSSYDRGHLCPAADRTFDKQAYLETFLTSNVSPQEHEFNSGIWNRLEQKVRYWAERYDGIYVVTGGVLNDRSTTIGDEDVTVPKQFYKVLLDQRGDGYAMLAFLIPAEASNAPLPDFVVSVDRIEQLTGIDFFPQLEDSVEARLEAGMDYKGWSFK